MSHYKNVVEFHKTKKELEYVKNMLKFYESTENYEKCSKLRDKKNTLQAKLAELEPKFQGVTFYTWNI